MAENAAPRRRRQIRRDSSPRREDPWRRSLILVNRRRRLLPARIFRWPPPWLCHRLHRLPAAAKAPPPAVVPQKPGRSPAALALTLRKRIIKTPASSSEASTILKTSVYIFVREGIYNSVADYDSTWRVSVCPGANFARG